MLLLVVNQQSKKEGGINICYQETANVATSCGGLNSGNYGLDGGWQSSPQKYFWDSDWTSSANVGSGNGYFWVNYSLPSGAISAQLEIKTGRKYLSYRDNITIPVACLINPVQFYHHAARVGSGAGSYVETFCNDGTGFNTLLRKVECNDCHSIYEEAMWWDIDASNCNTVADLPTCDGCVDDDEYAPAKSKWLNQNGVSDDDWPSIKSNWLLQTGC